MSGLFGGGGQQQQQQPTSTTVTNTNLPAYAQPYVEKLFGQAGALTDINQNPYQQYGGQRLADFTPMQQQAFNTIGGMQVSPQTQQATGLAGAAGLGSLGAGQNYNRMATDPGAIQAFMSPYQQNVTDYQKQQAVMDYGRQLPGTNAAAVNKGAFGGSRQAIVEGEGQRNLQNQLAGIQATGSQNAFQNAQQAQQFGANLGLQGMGLANQSAGLLGQMGQQNYAQQMGINAAQQQAGAQQQAFNQQGLTNQYQDFLNRQNYPYQQLGFMSDIIRGTPTGGVTTAQKSEAAPSMFSQIAGSLGGLGSLAGAYNAFGKAEGGEIKGYAEGGAVEHFDGGGLASLPNAAEMLAAKNIGAGKASLDGELALGGDLTRLLMASMLLKETQAKLEIAKLASGANPQTNVAQDIAMQQQQVDQGQQPQQMAQAPQQGMPPQQMDQGQQPPQQSGLASLPSQNFNPENYMGGGIVAFDGGGIAHGVEGLYVDAAGNAMTREQVESMLRDRRVNNLLPDNSRADFTVDSSGNARPEIPKGTLPATTTATTTPPSSNLPSTQVRPELRTIREVPAPTPSRLDSLGSATSKVGRALTSPVGAGIQGVLYSSEANANEPYQNERARVTAEAKATNNPQLLAAYEAKQKEITKARAGTFDELGVELDAINRQIQDTTTANRELGGAVARNKNPAAFDARRTELTDTLTQLKQRRDTLQREYEIAAKASGITAVTNKGGIANPTMQRTLTGIATQTPAETAKEKLATAGVLDRPLIPGAGGAEKPVVGQPGAAPASKIPFPYRLEGDPQTIANEIAGASADDQAGIRAQYKQQTGVDLPPASGKGTATTATPSGRPVAENDPIMAEFIADQRLGRQMMMGSLRETKPVLTAEEYARADKIGEDAFLKAQGMPTSAESMKQRMDKLVSEGTQARKDRDVDRWLAAAQGFFAMGAGKSQYALQNIATGLGIGTKELRDVEKDYRKGAQLRADKTDLLGEAARLEARGDFAKGNTRRKEAEKLNEDIEKNRLTVGEKLLASSNSAIGTLQAKRDALALRGEVAEQTKAYQAAQLGIRNDALDRLKKTDAETKFRGRLQLFEAELGGVSRARKLYQDAVPQKVLTMVNRYSKPDIKPEDRTEIANNPAFKDHIAKLQAFDRRENEIEQRKTDHIRKEYGDPSDSDATSADPLGLKPKK